LSKRQLVLVPPLLLFLLPSPANKILFGWVKKEGGPILMGPKDPWEDRFLEGSFLKDPLNKKGRVKSNYFTLMGPVP
jgi:hypothetical protein